MFCREIPGSVLPWKHPVHYLSSFHSALAFGETKTFELFIKHSLLEAWEYLPTTVHAHKLDVNNNIECFKEWVRRIDPVLKKYLVTYFFTKKITIVLFSLDVQVLRVLPSFHEC